MSRPTVLRRVVAPLALIGAVAVSACGSDDAARVDVGLSVDMPASVPLDEPLHITYTWEPGAEFVAPMDDYQVFVHARDAAGNVLFQDDHYPTEPTSQWGAGTAQTYERWLYVPSGVEVETINFAVGLYSPDGRVLLRGDGGTWTDAVEAHSLEVRVDDMSGVPAYVEGWHAQEQDAASGETWRWSEAQSRAAFTNTRRDSILHLSAHGPFDEVGAQVLVLRVGEAEIWRFDIDSAATFSERVEVPASVMGDDDWVELTLEVSPALVPKEIDPESVDERVLGLQVFRLYLSSS
jgi:hypothetical protein